VAGLEQPVDLGTQRAVATAGVADVLEELVAIDAALELGIVEEVVLATIDLGLPARPRRRRRRDAEAIARRGVATPAVTLGGPVDSSSWSNSTPTASRVHGSPGARAGR